MTTQSIPLVLKAPRRVAGFTHWLRTHLGVVTMAGLFSFAAPLTFFTGILSVMREPNAADVLTLALWWLLYGVMLGCLLLIFGYACQHTMRGSKPWARRTVGLLCAAIAAACATLSTAGRAAILIEQGVVQSALAMHLNAFVLSLTMALLFFAHLRRSRTQEEAALRLAAAQTAQREARHRIVQARLQALHARIDPQLLFEMLDAVRHAYEADSTRAERLLDELINFLRAALPRLRTASSSVLREAELARAYSRLRALAGATDVGMTLHVAADVIHARFPPGVLLPLLEDALRTRSGACSLGATHAAGGECRVVMTLPVRPSASALARVRSLLTDVYGTLAGLSADDVADGVVVTLKVPYEFA